MMLLMTRMKVMLLGNTVVEEVWGRVCSLPGSTTQRSGSLRRCNQPQAFECCSRKTPEIMKMSFGRVYRPLLFRYGSKLARQ